VFTEQDYIDLEKELAVLLGWTAVEQAGMSLIGAPPRGSEHSRGQAAVPRWVRDWTACGPLVAEYGMSILQDVDGAETVEIQDNDGVYMAHTPFSNHSGKDGAVRFAVVQAATAKEGLKSA
jgi:hypothetical protein